MKIRDELNRFYKHYNIPENGGEDERFFIVPLPVFSLKLPNSDFRREKLYIHDIEHLLNKQDTSWKGEIYIASWEISTGFWKYFPVCLFPLWTMGFGLWKHPFSVFRGFTKGLNDFGIAQLNLSKKEILDLTLQQISNLTENKKENVYSHFLLFSCWVLISQLVFLFPFIFIILLVFTFI